MKDEEGERWIGDAGVKGLWRNKTLSFNTEKINN